MAYEIVISDSTFRAKHRNPWGVLGLTLVTLGIYHLYWWYEINRELRDLGYSRRASGLGDSPALSLLALWFGSFGLFIPTVWTVVTTSRRVRRAQELTDANDRLSGILSAVLWIFTLGLGGMIYTQSQLNKVWDTKGMTPVFGGVQAAPQLPAAQTERGPAWNSGADLDRIKTLAELRDSGALSDEEFAAEKAKALGDAGRAEPTGSST